jgi:3',5'-cyclic AMP phosphodiesterase CpdA
MIASKLNGQSQHSFMIEKRSLHGISIPTEQGFVDAVGPPPKMLFSEYMLNPVQKLTSDVVLPYYTTEDLIRPSVTLLKTQGRSGHDTIKHLCKPVLGRLFHSIPTPHPRALKNPGDATVLCISSMQAFTRSRALLRRKEGVPKSWLS